jgi:hypothetical protein
MPTVEDDLLQDAVLIPLSISRSKSLYKKKYKGLLIIHNQRFT